MFDDEFRESGKLRLELRNLEVPDTDELPQTAELLQKGIFCSYRHRHHRVRFAIINAKNHLPFSDRRTIPLKKLFRNILASLNIADRNDDSFANRALLTLEI